MARREKITRKELLKEPDQFLTTSEKLAAFFSDHGPMVLSVLIGVVVIAAGIAGFKYNRKVTHLENEKLYFEMETIQAKAEKKKPEEVLAQLKALRDQFSDGPQKSRADLLLAGSYFQNGDQDQALALYSEVLNASAPGQLSHQLARVGIGAVHEGKKEYGKAMEVYKSIIEKPNGYPLFPIYLGLARCYEQSQDNDNALKILREAKAKFHDHPMTAQIDRKIKELSGTV